MFKLKLTIICLTISSLGFSQVYKGSIASPSSTPVQFREVAPNDFLYHVNTNDSLFLWDENLVSLPSIALNTPAGEQSFIRYISKDLFDSDPGIEFLLQYDSAGQRSNVFVYDGGTLTPFPNFSGFLFGARLTNLSVGSELSLYSNPQQPTTYIYTLSGQISSNYSINSLPIEKLKLSPNPTQDIVKVPGFPNEVLQIYDQSGKHLMDQRMNGRQAIIDVSDFQNGVYIIRSNQGSSYKFIKQ